MGGENAEFTLSCVWINSFQSEGSGGVATGEPMKIPHLFLQHPHHHTSLVWSDLNRCSDHTVSWSQSVKRLWKLDSPLKSQFQHTALCQTYSILLTTPENAGFSTPKQLYM